MGSNLLSPFRPDDAVAPGPLARERDWHLTEALCKPLHRFDDRELEGLIRELKSSGYEEREDNIQRAVAEIVARVGESGMAGYDPYTMLPSNRVRFDVPMRTQFGNYTRLHVTLPSWLPPQYVKPFAGRMIRDQLEEV